MAGKRKLAVVSADEISSEEKAMEEFLFGKKTLLASQPQWEDMEEAVQFSIDTAPSAVEVVGAPVPAWHDEDDDKVMVDLDQTARLKRLKHSKQASGSNRVTGRELSGLLKERFQPKAFDWTTVPLEEAARNELLDDEDYDLLQSAEDMLGKRTGAAQTQPLQPERIRMQRVLDANAAAPVSGAVTCTAFHPDSSMIAVGGSDKSLRLFATDGQHNALLLGVRFKDLAVRSAGFLKHRTEMLVSGRKPYFYVLDTATGQLAKMPGPGSGQTNLQHLAVSPEGSRFAVIGRGGHVHVGDGASKLWVEQLAMNGQASSVCFLSDHLLASSTKEAGVYLWDLRHSRRPLVGKWTHDDGSATCSLSAYCPSPSYANTHSNKFALDSAYLSVGTASGVLSVFQGVDEGVVRGRGGAAGGAEGNYYPLTAAVEEVGAGMRQVRTVMNLTTQISCSAFHPSGQLLAMASYESKDALKLVHLPSYSVYSNWPQRLTPLHTVETLAFSPDGGCLAVGNKRGKVLLFQLPHFMDGAARRGLRDKRRLN